MNNNTIKLIIIIILIDIHYIIFYNKLKLYNDNNNRVYIPINIDNPYKKNINIININSLEKLEWEFIKNNSNNFKEPVIFQLNNTLKLKLNIDRILKKQKKIQVQNIYTKQYVNINYENYDPNKYIIFNQTILNNDFHFEDLDIKFIVFSNYFKTMKNSVTGIHNEINSTLNFQLTGRKKWILVDPNYSESLYPIKSSWRNYVTKFGRRKIREDELKHIPHYNCILKPNQILFIPSWWWHHIISLDDNTESLSLRTMPPFTIFHKYFMPVTPTSILLSLYISYIYKQNDDTNVQAYQIASISHIPTFK